MSPPVNGLRLSSLKQTNLKARKPQAIDRPEVYPPASPCQSKALMPTLRSGCFLLMFRNFAIGLTCQLRVLANLETQPCFPVLRKLDHLLVQRRLELQAHAGEDTFVNHLQRRHINQLALDCEQLGAVIDETEAISDVPTLLWQFSPLKDRAISGIHMPQLGSNLGDKDPAS